MFNFWKKGPCIEEPPTLVLGESVIEWDAMSYETELLNEFRDRVSNREFGYEDLGTQVKGNIISKIVQREHVQRAFLEVAQEMIEELKQHETR